MPLTLLNSRGAQKLEIKRALLQSLFIFLLGTGQNHVPHDFFYFVKGTFAAQVLNSILIVCCQSLSLIFDISQM